MLVWNETDVTTCLEIEPEVGEDGTSHRYHVARDGLSLEFTVWQYDGDVAIKLRRDGVEAPIFETHMLDCAGVRYVKDQAGERLECAPAKSVYGRYDGVSPLALGVSVAVTPHIALRLFSQAT